MLNGHRPLVLGLDAGGTMTDALLVDEDGDFIVGKALSTPGDESVGVLNSFSDGLRQWGVSLEDGAAGLQATVYSGTAMLNRVLTRQGEGPIGLITTAGFEDTLRMERGIQVWLGLSYPDRLHAVSHSHNEPFVPQRLIRGVRERINVFGNELIPLYEDEARLAIQHLLDEGVKAICVCLLFSFRNPAHEFRIEEIASEIMARNGHQVPLLLSARHNPVRGELPRMQTLILEAYAAAPSRVQIKRVQNRLRETGSKAPLRLMACYGGTIPPDHEWLVSTLISGPIGGITGAQYVGNVLGVPNLVCSDVGGTSFDVGLITDGQYALEVEPSIARMKLALPSVVIESIGAGTGTYIRLDPVIKRIELGPDSAGYKIGMAVKEETPTVNDCDLILGYLDPEYFLGGAVPLDVERAARGLEEQVARPLHIGVHEAAWGIRNLISTQMRDHLYAMILGRGFSPEVYSLMSYGGGGPLHVANYSAGLNFQKIYVPTWAPAFSAFGCACADYSFRYDQQLDFPLSADLREREALTGYLNSIWAALQTKIHSEMRNEGLDTAGMEFRPMVRMQYKGMLDDLEILSPAYPLTPEGLPGLLRNFDQVYERVFPAAAKSPEMGYMFTRAVAIGVVPTEKPVLREHSLHGVNPPPAARKAPRQIYWAGAWVEAAIYDMDALLPGNVCQGPAVVEAPATTFLIPPANAAYLNAYRIFELTRA